MANSVLDLSNVISITIQGSPTNLGVPNINTVALISKEVPENYGSAAFKIYTSPGEVATDWGSDSDAFAIATGFFAQQPNPLGSGGYLTIIPRLQSPSLESIEAAIIRTIGQIYYAGILVDEEMDGATFAALAIYIQTLDKMLFYASSNQNDFAPGGMLDLVRQAAETHVRCLYYSDGTAIDTQVMAAAYASRAMSTNFDGSQTTQTMHLKVLSGITPDQTMNQTALLAAETAGVDVYVNIAGVPSLFTSGANAFFDEVYNELAFKFALQTAGFNFLRDASTKVPQTEQGMGGLKNAYRQVCDQFVSNGFIAPGLWTSPVVFGNPPSLIRSVGDIGYYVYSTPISQQSVAARDAREAPLVQIAVKAAGAIHKSDVIVFVNL